MTNFSNMSLMAGDDNIADAIDLTPKPLSVAWFPFAPMLSATAGYLTWSD